MVRWIGWVLLVQFILINVCAAIYAYRFTYFREAADRPVNDKPPSHFFAKTWHLFSGPAAYKAYFNPADTPIVRHESFTLHTASGIPIEGWWLKQDTARRTMLMFHGLAGSRQRCLAEASAFYNMGYDVLLIDFRAHGKSGGSVTTYGARETEEVHLLYEYARTQQLNNISFWGISMGASTIFKAMHDYPGMQPRSIIADAPFNRLQDHLKGRARTVGFPGQPFAWLVTGWISIERGFNAYSYSTAKYASEVKCPVLLQWGSADALVTAEEVKDIYEKTGSARKQWVVYENIGHASFLHEDPALWNRTIRSFLNQ
ncbi:alpha/beta hydrolase [Nostoc ellipsosporum NOK]|nr:alpha/beta hydrolase [Nostoc ellipsosporum NOK]